MKESGKNPKEMGKHPLLHRRVIRSEDLFEKDREVMILHGESYYRLQITKAGKLILNK